jgi:pullulanase/glycogen debranching enzyme
MTVNPAKRAREIPTKAPRGAHHDGSGASFALFSSVAEAVEVCLFDQTGEETRWDLEQCDGFEWRGYVPDVRPGQHYGFRVLGSGGGHPLQPRQAASRSIRARRDRGGAMESRCLRSRGR